MTLHTTPLPHSALPRQAGVGLIELLVAMLVIALGVLGMAGLQGRGLQAEMESYQRAQALILLNDMADRLRANRTARACYNLSDAGLANLGSGATFTGSGCNPTANIDLLAWHQALLGESETMAQGEGETATTLAVGSMIGARGCIVQQVDGTFVVSVAWQGLGDTFAPTDTCGQNAYGSELRRRVVSTRVRFADL